MFLGIIADKSPMIFRILSLALGIGLLYLGLQVAWNSRTSKENASIEEDSSKRSRIRKSNPPERFPASLRREISDSSSAEGSTINRSANFETSPLEDNFESAPNEKMSSSPGTIAGNSSPVAPRIPEAVESKDAPKRSEKNSDSSPAGPPSQTFAYQPPAQLTSSGSDSDSNDLTNPDLPPSSGGGFVEDSPVPELSTLTAKTFWQTTELPGTHAFTSPDFGSLGHFAGVMNFRSNNVTSSGLDMSCDELVDGDHSAMVPLPGYLMSDTDVSGEAPNSRASFPLFTGDFDYGPNYVVSYVRNESVVPFAYRCETRMMVLQDFPFFDPNPMVRIPTDGTNPDFVGGFTHLGFFETSTEMNRGPAGSSSSLSGTQELETGILPVFH